MNAATENSFDDMHVSADYVIFCTPVSCKTPLPGAHRLALVQYSCMTVL